MFSVLGRDAISETLREKLREREQKLIKRFILTVKMSKQFKSFHIVEQ